MSAVFGVIANPRSRRNRRDPVGLLRLARAAAPYGVLAECSDEAALGRAIQQFRAEGMRAIAISGGDGTNHMVLSQVLRTYGDAPLPLFVFLRGGTMNTVARGLRVQPAAPERTLAALGRALARGTPMHVVQRACLLAADEAGFLFGTGAAHGFLAEYYRSGEPSPEVALRTLLRGAASAFVGGATVARIVRPFVGEVELGTGERWPWRSYLSVTAGTVADMGLGFRPFYRADQGLHALGIFASPLAFVAGLPRVRAALPLGDSRCYDVTTPALTLRSDGPIEFMVDGDLRVADRELHVRRGPLISLVLSTNPKPR